MRSIGELYGGSVISHLTDEVGLVQVILPLDYNYVLASINNSTLKNLKDDDQSSDVLKKRMRSIFDILQEQAIQAKVKIEVKDLEL